MDGPLGIIFRNKYKFLFLTLAVIAAFVGFSIYNSYRDLSITYSKPNTGVKVDVYKVPDNSNYDNPSQAVNKTNLVKEVSQDTKIRLKKGHYVVATSGNDDYQQQVKAEDLTKTSQAFDVSPTYSDKKLSSLLTQEQSSIRAAINQSVGGLSSKYRINAGKLYLNADWYGTTIALNLTPKQRQTQYIDVFRLIAHKDNGTWRVITLPPALILTQSDYPSVPHEVLVDVNQMPQ